MATLTKDSAGNYVVKSGDSLSKIASSHGYTLSDLLAQNPQFAKNPNLIQPGQIVNFGTQAPVAPKTVSSAPSYQGLVAGTSATAPTQPTLLSQNTTPQAPVQPTMSFTQALTQMLKDAQSAQQQGSANLMKQQQGITATGLNQASNVSNMPILTPQGRISLRDSAINAVKPGELSVQNQLQLANQGLTGINNLIEREQKAYEAEHPKVTTTVVEVGNRKVLINDATGEVIKDLGAAPKASGGGSSNVTSDNERALLSVFQSSPIVKNYNDVVSQKLSIDNIVRNGVGGPADLALVFSFMKGLDPNSVVRESEYDKAAASGNLFKGWASKFNGYLKEEGGFLPANVQKEFQNLVNQKLAAQKQQYDNYAKSFQGIAQRQGLNPNNVVVDFSGAIVPVQSATGEIKQVNGIKYIKNSQGLWQKQ